MNQQRRSLLNDLLQEHDAITNELRQIHGSIGMLSQRVNVLIGRQDHIRQSILTMMEDRPAQQEFGPIASSSRNPPPMVQETIQATRTPSPAPQSYRFVGYASHPQRQYQMEIYRDASGVLFVQQNELGRFIPVDGIETFELPYQFRKWLLTERGRQTFRRHGIVLSPAVLSHLEDIGAVFPHGVEVPDRRQSATPDRRQPATPDRRQPATPDHRQPATPDRRPVETVPLSPFPAIDAAMARLNRLLGAVELLSRHLGGAGDEVAEIRRSLGRFAAVDVAAPEEYPVRPDMLILFVEEELARLLERMDLIMPGEMDSPMDADRIRTRRRHAVGLIVATLNAVDRLRQI